MADRESKSTVIEIRKYQNRRYYDTTNSQHLSLEKIHKLICRGYDVKVTDAKSGQDITTKILTQILLEYEPMKLDFFSPTMLMQVIRLNDIILKDFYETYFSKALSTFVNSKDQFDTLFRQSQALPFANPMVGMGDSRNPFSSWFSMNPFAPVEDPDPTPLEDKDSELEYLRRQVVELKERLNRQTP